MAVIYERSADAKEYNYLIRRNAHLEDVNEYQRERLDALETEVRRLGAGLWETTRVLMALHDEVKALLTEPVKVGYRCAHCQDTGMVLVGSGAPDDSFDEDSCPVCDGREEPEQADIDLDALEAPPPEEKP
jgi:hypothetical protein